MGYVCCGYVLLMFVHTVVLYGVLWSIREVLRIQYNGEARGLFFRRVLPKEVHSQANHRSPTVR